jgi:hypothetical protein
MGILPVAILVMAGLCLTLRKVSGNGKNKIKTRSRSLKRVQATNEKTYIPSFRTVLMARVPLLVALVVISFLYSMGKYTPFFDVLWYCVPILQKFRWPTKSLMCFVLALSCLSGIALDWLRATVAAEEKTTHGPRRLLAEWGTVLLFSALSLIAGLCLVNNGALGETILTSFFNLDSVEQGLKHRVEWHVLGWSCLVLAVMGPLSTLLLHAYVFRPRWRAGASVLMPVILFADLGLAGTTLLPSADSRILEQDRTYIDQLQAGTEPVRFFEHNPLTQFWLYGVWDENTFHLARNTLAGGWATADHAYAVTQTSSFLSADMAAVLSICRNEQVPPAAKERLLRMLNCHTVIAFPDIWQFLIEGKLDEPNVIELAPPLPRAYVVGGVKIEDAQPEVLGFLVHADFDPLEIAVADVDSVGNDRFYDLIRGKVEHKVERIEYLPNRLEVEVWSERPGVLVVSDAHYPGWRAAVNGEDVTLFKVNGAFRGVRVSEGKNAVVMTYRPMSFLVGSALSCITLVACLALLTREKWKSSHATPRRGRADE